MASSLYDGLKDAELNSSANSSSSWVLRFTDVTSEPVSNETGIGRLFASESAKKHSDDFDTNMKLLQSQITAKRERSKRDPRNRPRQIITPAFNLNKDSKEETFRFNQLSGKLELVSDKGVSSSTKQFSSKSRDNSAVTDEYNPLYPNDYEEISHQRNEKKKAEKALAAANDFNKGRNLKMENNRMSDSDSEEESEISRNRNSRRDPKINETKVGAAIAPPSSLLEEVHPVPTENTPLAETPSYRSSCAEENNKCSVVEKMMQKMGYRQGQGLGREGQGMASALIVQKTSRNVGKIVNQWDDERRASASLVKSANEQSSFMSSAQSTQFTLANATNVVLLQNMCSPGEVDDDLEAETAEECAKYGTVVSCMLFQLLDVGDEEAVRIFVEFQEQPAALRAVRDLNGRFFGGRVVKAGFYDNNKFINLELKDPPLTS